MWFILFVSILSVFHSMFLNEGRIVFHYSWFSLHFLDLLFVLAIVFLPGCLIVYLLGVCCFHLPRFAVLFRWIVFVWHHLVCLVLGYSFVSVFFLWISSNSKSENQPFFVIVLSWSANLWLVVWNIESSCQISIILFLWPLCEGLLLK